MSKTNYICDYETNINCFMGVFVSHRKDDNEPKVFVVHESRNDIRALIDFLDANHKEGSWHIGYNILDFDSQITNFILEHRESFLTGNPKYIAYAIYEFAQLVIDLKSRNEFLPYRQKDSAIPVIDVFKINHWDNPAKMSSLKWIQFNIRYPRLAENPYMHYNEIEDRQIPEMISYCINDCLSTKEILYLTKDQIDLRKTLSNTYSLDLINASEPRIVKEIFLKLLSEKSGISKYDLKAYKTERDKIVAKDILLPVINFRTPDFQKVHEFFKEQIINPKKIKDALKLSITYKGCDIDFGLGGIHGCRPAGIYKSTADRIIVTADVKSFYPNLAIRNKWSPAHLPKKEFTELYEFIYQERVKIPKSDPRNYVYKIILNSLYGLMNEENSFVYDPEVAMRITINGQLLLLMLCELISIEIPDSIPLMLNTDGLEFSIPRSYEGKYLKLCKQWEAMTGLELEHDMYQKMIIADVNNYIAVHDPKEISEEEYKKLSAYSIRQVLEKKGDKYYHSKIKCKGRFEFENLALHKNSSFLIVPKSIYNYFIHDIPVEDTVRDCKDIYDFCGGVRAKGDWILHQAVAESASPIVISQKTNSFRGKIARYICTRNPYHGKLVKFNKVDHRKIMVHSYSHLDNGKQMFYEKVLNEISDPLAELSSVHRDVYIDMAMREIRIIITLQPETEGTFDHQMDLFEDLNF